MGLASARMALADPTAFDLVSKGDQYVGVQSKDKIIEISSDKSVGSVEPNIWHLLYFDPDSTFKSVQVTFGAGQEMEVAHPFRMFPNNARDVLDWSSLSVDSNRALKIASSQPLLQNLTLKSSKLTLANTDDGVVWKVELWAAKVNDATKEADLGSVEISATDRSVVKTDLHPSNAE